MAVVVREKAMERPEGVEGHESLEARGPRALEVAGGWQGCSTGEVERVRVRGGVTSCGGCIERGRLTVQEGATDGRKTAVRPSAGRPSLVLVGRRLRAGEAAGTESGPLSVLP